MAVRKKGWLVIVGPGVLVAATGVGAGDLATGALVGSKLGTAVLWAVVLGAGLKYLLTEGLARWQMANRIHHDGTVLMVDYGPCEGHVGQHIAGHAVYTRRKWLLFHAEQFVKHLYQTADLKVT